MPLCTARVDVSLSELVALKVRTVPGSVTLWELQQTEAIQSRN